MRRRTIELWQTDEDVWCTKGGGYGATELEAIASEGKHTAVSRLEVDVRVTGRAYTYTGLSADETSKLVNAGYAVTQDYDGTWITRKETKS